MKKTLSLLGWLALGITLLLNPTTGLVTASEAAAELIQTESIQGEPAAITTEGPPPPDSTTAVPAPQIAMSSDGSTMTDPVATSASAATTGAVADSKFGPFQVEIIVEDGILIDVLVLQEPGDGRSASINRTALPVYEELALETQGTDFDALSGATITWEAYTTSLQSALDAAGI